MQQPIGTLQQVTDADKANGDVASPAVGIGHSPVGPDANEPPVQVETRADKRTHVQGQARIAMTPIEKGGTT